MFCHLIRNILGREFFSTDLYVCVYVHAHVTVLVLVCASLFVCVRVRLCVMYFEYIFEYIFHF